MNNDYTIDNSSKSSLINRNAVDFDLTETHTQDQLEFDFALCHNWQCSCCSWQ